MHGKRNKTRQNNNIKQLIYKIKTEDKKVKQNMMWKMLWYLF